MGFDFNDSKKMRYQTPGYGAGEPTQIRGEHANPWFLTFSTPPCSLVTESSPCSSSPYDDDRGLSPGSPAPYPGP